MYQVRAIRKGNKGSITFPKRYPTFPHISFELCYTGNGLAVMVGHAGQVPHLSLKVPTSPYDCAKVDEARESRCGG